MKYLFSKWHGLTIYQRFENLIALVLRLTVSVIILSGLYRLITAVVSGLVFDALNPLEPEVFHTIFGDILTVLIALEFNHTLNYLASREQSVIQTKIVLLISILALARKLIIMDLSKTSPNQLFGLAAVTLALGITYWLMRERDDRLIQSREKGNTGETTQNTAL
jgi:uncharacterized membrane protein (DUF373 family)